MVRKSTPALIEGKFKPLSEEEDEYLAFLRTTDEQCILVILNYSKKRQAIKLDLGEKASNLLFSSTNRKQKEGSQQQLSVEPFEIYIAELR